MLRVQTTQRFSFSKLQCCDMNIANQYIRVARILSGLHFFLIKLTTFLVVASKTRSKTTNLSSKSS